jgi:hypothetical protein
MKENHLKHHIFDVGSKHKQLQSHNHIIFHQIIKGTITNSSFSFKAMVIISCKALESNQCPWGWLMT